MVYAVLSALRSITVGPLSALLVGCFFSSSLQGFYYTFKSLVAMALVLELGLPLVVVPFVAHEWVRVTWDGRELHGPAEALDRLRGLCRGAVLWYLLSAPVVALGTLLVGARWIDGSQPVDAGWFAVWCWLCLWSGADYLVRPFLALLEGCQQVEPVFRVRLWQGLLSSAATWILIATGGGLWCLVAGMLCSALFGIVALFEYRFLLRSLLRRPETAGVRWRAEVWPMSWRIALTSLGGMVSSSAGTPLVFRLRGPEMAGQLGMTLALSQGLGTIMVTWAQVRAPRLAELVARREPAQLHRLLARLTLLTVGTGLFGALSIELLVAGLHVTGQRLATRMFSELPMALFLLSSVVGTSTVPVAMYLRAHKQEPFLLPTLVGAVLLVALLYLLAPPFGALGVGWAYLGTTLALTPVALWIGYRCQRKWYP